MKAYLLVSGSYSDYYVHAVFNDRALAEAYLATGSQAYGWSTDEGSYEQFRIEERSLNPDHPLQVRQGLKYWRVWMRNDGTVLEVQQARLWFDDEPTGEGISVGSFSHSKDCLIGDIWARDEQHAVKIMNERRIQWLRETTKL